MHLRDTGVGPASFRFASVRARSITPGSSTQLQRYGYNRALTVAIIDRIENPFDREVEVRKLKLLLETLI